MTVYFTGVTVLLSFFLVLIVFFDDFDDDFYHACVLVAVWPLIAATALLIITLKLLEKLRC